MNVDGILGKSTELLEYLNRNSIDVAMIQETKLTAKKNFNLTGYDMCRKDRTTRRNINVSTDKIGGGVAIFIKSGIPYTILDDNVVATDDKTTEAIGVNLPSVKLNVYSIYVPEIREGTEGESRTQKFDPEFLPWKDRTLFGGDFNCRDLLWDTQGTPDRMGERLADVYLTKNFNILNDGTATFLNRVSNKKSAIDLSFASADVAPLFNWKVDSPIGRSDHCCIIMDVEIGIPSRPKTYREKRNVGRTDWVLFRSVLTKLLEESTDEPSDKFFTACVKRAFTKAAPMSRIKYNAKPFWTKECSEAVKKRNQANWVAHLSEQHRQTYRELAAEADRVISKAKRDHWQKHVETVAAAPDATSRSFKLIKSIEGRGRQPMPSSTLKTSTGKELHHPRDRANEFAKFYSDRSQLKSVTKAERFAESTKLKAALKDIDNPDNFTYAELNFAINSLSIKKAAGWDGIPSECFHNLPDIGKSYLLVFLNKSLASGLVPRSMKLGIIKPIPKQGKPPGAVSSYRPISLLTSLSKLIEIMVRNRVLPLTKISPEQAGYQAHRSCEDQAVYLTQSIEDGFQRKERTALCLVDFTGAFDTVWRARLLNKLLVKGLPPGLVKWVKSFLEDRRSFVQLEGGSSKKVRLYDGVPQGSILSPILFAIFIDDLTDAIKATGARIALYADDVAIWTQSTNISIAEESLQVAVDALEQWCSSNHLTVSINKTMVSLFTLHNLEASAQLNINFQNGNLPFESRPKYLGVTLDRALTFGAHVDTITKNLCSRIKAIQCLASRSWGNDVSSMRQFHRALITSKADYCSAAWATRASNTTLEKVDATVRKSARVVTGLCAGTPKSVVHHLIDEPPIAIRAENHAARIYESTKRIADHPLNYLEPPRNRLTKRSDWRKTATSTVNRCELNEFGRLPYPPHLDVSNLRNEISYSFHLSSIPKDLCVQERLTRTKEFLFSLPKQDNLAELYCDGSAKDGTEFTGAGISLITPSGEKHELAVSAGRYGSSYEAECTAMLEGLRMAEAKLPSEVPLRILTDSLSLVSALRSGPNKDWSAKLRDIDKLLRDRSSTQIVHVPAHIGLEGNERADVLAGEGARKEQYQPLPYRVSVNAVKREVRTRWLNELHAVTQTGSAARYHAAFNIPPKPMKVPRSEQVAINQLRSGHCPALMSYLHRIGSSPTPTCPECKLADETVEHYLLECAAFERQRLATFGPDPNISTILADNETLAAYMRSTGRLSPPVRH